MELVDAHCHLALLGSADAVARALRDAGAAGIGAVVTVDDPSDVEAFEGASFDRRSSFNTSSPRVHRVVGHHPWRAEEALDLDALRCALSDAVALGEVGLDGDSRRPPFARQLEVLRPQLELATELELPLVLHAYKHHEPLLALLGEQASRQGRALRGLVHGFSRGPELAARYTALGLSIGLGARLRDPRARRLHETARALPLSQLVLESDAPTDPIANLPATAQALAELRGLTAEQVAEETSRHARRLFGLDAGAS